MELVTINNKEYAFYGKLRGANTNKFNRVVKLAAQFEEFDIKFRGMFTRGSNSIYGLSEHARLSLATLLMMHTGIRVGNEGSAEGYMTKPHPNSKAEPKFVQTYGLTTLKKEHIVVKGRRVFLNFLGKKQVENSFVLHGVLAKQIRLLFGQCQTDTLFDITAYQLTKFIHTYVGKQFSPKDFRTMKANMEAWQVLSLILERPTPSTKKEFNAEIKEIAVHVSECLNNTPGVCKKSYIDDMLFTHHYEERWQK